MDITPEQSMEYQLRVSIYDTKNVPMVDIEGMSDVFIKAWIDEKNQKETDTHWRCSTGEASFNWRMLFNINCPNTSGKNELDAYKLKFAVYDRDILSGNDFICDYEIDLRLMMEDCKLTQRGMHLNKQYFESYFAKNYHKTDVTKSDAPQLKLEFEDDGDSFWLVYFAKDKDGNLEKDPIKLRVDIRLFPMTLVEANKVGDQRSEPNHSPELPKPVGRMEFSLNPFKMISQLIGPAFAKKLMAVACVCACLALCLMMLPFIASNLVSAVIQKMLGLG